MTEVEFKKTTTFKFTYDIIGEFVVVNSLYGPKKYRRPNIALLSWFEEQRAKKRGWRFLQRIPGEFQMLYVASANYFKFYQEGRQWQWREDEHGLRYVDPINYLRKHKTIKEADRLIRDEAWKDGWFYDLDGKPVWSRIHFDQISSPFSTSLYDLGKLIPLLNKWKDKDGTRIVNARIEDIPSYNWEHHDEKRVVFEVDPSQKFFEKISKEHRGGIRGWYGPKTQRFSRDWYKETFKKALHGYELRREY